MKRLNLRKPCMLVSAKLEYSVSARYDMIAKTALSKGRTKFYMRMCTAPKLIGNGIDARVNVICPEFGKLKAKPGQVWPRLKRTTWLDFCLTDALCFTV